MKDIRFHMLKIKDYYLVYRFLLFKKIKVSKLTKRLYKKELLYFLGYLHGNKINICDVNLDIINQYENHLKLNYKYARYKFKKSVAKSFCNYLTLNNLIKEEWFE